MVFDMYDEDRRAHVAAAREAADRYGGVVCRVSAAMALEWEVRAIPFRPQITIPRHRRLKGIDLSAVQVRRMNLAPDQVDGAITTKPRTVIDCLRWLAFPAGLCVADSALRHGFPEDELCRLAATAKGPGSVMVRRVVRHADRRAANVFESALRAICISVPGLCVEPQVPIGGEDFIGTPDLVDVRLRMAIEADSFAWHGTREGLVADTRRYNAFVVHGWLVLRFTWDDVMLRPAYVREVLVEAVAAQTDGGADETPGYQ